MVAKSWDATLQNLNATGPIKSHSLEVGSFPRHPLTQCGWERANGLASLRPRWSTCCQCTKTFQPGLSFQENNCSEDQSQAISNDATVPAIVEMHARE